MPGAYLHGWVGPPVNAWVKCKVTGEGKLIIDPTAFLENPPGEDHANKAPTSEWAFDHEADTDLHGSGFTDEKARAAINDIFGGDGKVDSNLDLDYKDILWPSNIFLKKSSGDTTYIKWSKFLNGVGYWFGVYKPGTGWLTGDLFVYDGSVYIKYVNTANFQGELIWYLENIPTEGESKKAPTSNWAYEHEATVESHPDYYTDKKAVDAFYSRTTTLDEGVYKDVDLSGTSMLKLDDATGDVDLQGFSGGYDGQIIFAIRSNTNNIVTIRHNNANAAVGDKILTTTGADITMPADQDGGFILIYLENWWRVLQTPP